MTDYRYITSAKCGTCNQLLWTTAGKNPPETINKDVVCGCGDTVITDNEVGGNAVAFSAEEFTAAVAQETGLQPNDINITQWQ